jgi:hypothetical protein
MVSLSSCVISMPNIRKDSYLNETKPEGYLLVSIHIQDDPDPRGLAFAMVQNRMGLFPSIWQWAALKAGENYIFIKLPAGSYTFKYVFDTALNRVFTEFELDDISLMVEPGVINYCGQIDVKIYKPQKDILSFVYAYLDNYNDAKQYLQTNYPNSIEKYSIKNNTPVMPPGNYRIPRITSGL